MVHHHTVLGVRCTEVSGSSKYSQRCCWKKRSCWGDLSPKPQIDGSSWTFMESIDIKWNRYSFCHYCNQYNSYVLGLVGTLSWSQTPNCCFFAIRTWSRQSRSCRGSIASRNTASLTGNLANGEPSLVPLPPKLTETCGFLDPNTSGPQKSVSKRPSDWNSQAGLRWAERSTLCSFQNIQLTKKKFLWESSSLQQNATRRYKKHIHQHPST